MALYENTIKLKGFLGKDAENFATGQKAFIVLSLATKSGYKDKQTNEWVNRTEWHRVIAFGKPAEYARNLKKGDYVEVEGELRSSEFEKRRTWEVRANIIRKLAAPARSDDHAPITEEDAA